MIKRKNGNKEEAVIGRKRRVRGTNGSKEMEEGKGEKKR